MSTWTDSDEVMLRSLLLRKNRALCDLEVLTPREAMASGLILQLEYDLNNRLRPEARPFLSYARTPRIGLQLMADYELVPTFFHNRVEVRWYDGVHGCASTQAFKSEGDRLKALNIAIADCVLRVLLFKEKNNG